MATILGATAAFEAGAERELTRSSAPCQSVLNEAFSGKVAPQDPSDEPAAKLVKRIRSAHQTSVVAKNRRKAR